MNYFEIGKIIGKLEIILNDIPNIEKELHDLENKIQYEYDVIELAKSYGRIEQLMIMSNKSKDDIKKLEDIFEEIKNERISKFKEKTIEELRINGIPIKKLNDNGIFTVKELCGKTIQELNSISGISEKTVERIVEKLNQNCIYLK